MLIPSLSKAERSCSQRRRALCMPSCKRHSLNSCHVGSFWMCLICAGKESCSFSSVRKMSSVKKCNAPWELVKCFRQQSERFQNKMVFGFGWADVGLEPSRAHGHAEGKADAIAVGFCSARSLWWNQRASPPPGCWFGSGKEDTGQVFLATL